MKKSNKNKKLYDWDLETAANYVKATERVRVLLADLEMLNEISIREGFSEAFDFEGFRKIYRGTINAITQKDKRVVWNGSYSVVHLDVKELHTDFSNRTSVRCKIQLTNTFAAEFDCEVRCFVALEIQQRIDAEQGKKAVEPNLMLRELYYEACAEDIKEVA